MSEQKCTCTEVCLGTCVDLPIKIASEISPKPVEYCAAKLCEGIFDCMQPQLSQTVEEEISKRVEAEQNLCRALDLLKETAKMLDPRTRGVLEGLRERTEAAERELARAREEIEALTHQGRQGELEQANVGLAQESETLRSQNLALAEQVRVLRELVEFVYNDEMRWVRKGITSKSEWGQEAEKVLAFPPSRFETCANAMQAVCDAARVLVNSDVVTTAKWINYSEAYSNTLEALTHLEVVNQLGSST